MKNLNKSFNYHNFLTVSPTTMANHALESSCHGEHDGNKIELLKQLW
jgi:hypothetical protein